MVKLILCIVAVTATLGLTARADGQIGCCECGGPSCPSDPVPCTDDVPGEFECAQFCIGQGCTVATINNGIPCSDLVFCSASPSSSAAAPVLSWPAAIIAVLALIGMGLFKTRSGRRR